MIRKMTVNGAFYPHTKEEIIASFEYFNNLTCKHFSHALYDEEVKGIVVPHAGYVYSGFSANLAYKNVKKKPKRVVVVGPSHRVGFHGVSLVEFDSYETPLGEIETDSEYASLLKEQFDFVQIPEAHFEHSTEVQFPFIKYYFPKTKVVELVYGQDALLEGIFEAILQDAETLLVISTDLSHFHNQKKANLLDGECVKAFENLDLKTLEHGEACGKQGLVAAIKASKKLLLKTKSVDYRTSGDITKDYDRVVGYYSAIIY
ncbi:MAG: hypothetical protein PWQ42_963 [Sulfurospirillum sp.]|nr:hypothetical protein [Sulfurospirillum sp.]